MQDVSFLPVPLQDIVSRYWQRLTGSVAYAEEQTATLFENDAEFFRETATVWAASEFVAETTLRHPALLRQAQARRLEGVTDYLPRLAALLQPLREQSGPQALAELKSRLRQFHRLELLLIIWRDLCGFADVHEVCRQMSELADACLQGSLDILHGWSCREMGCPLAQATPQQLVVIGMGKLGANELNVSSDIDLIFAFPRAGHVDQVDASGDAMTNQQFFTRLGQRLIDVLDTNTADGFVFRVDMRLRPYGSEGALVASFDAMEDYYQSQGRDWERYALIKARVVAGDLVEGGRLLKTLQPFVYRRYLDFSMFESLRGMKSQIDKQARRGGLANDIKLGSGGIREVEFVIQSLQLVYGGRDKTLRQPSLRSTMENLVAGEYLPRETVVALLQSYEFLRRLEHRLQAFANQQTQSLPTNPEIRARIAFSMGAADWTELAGTLAAQRAIVNGHFREVLKTEESLEETRQLGEDWIPLWRLELADEEARRLMQESGFEDPAGSLALLQDFRKGNRFLTLSAEGRNRLSQFMPILLDAVCDSEKPSLCLARVMLLVEAVCKRSAYLVLLLENPQALQQVVFYCTASPLIAEYLSRYPVLLDELLHVLDTPPEKSMLADELKLQLLRIEEGNFEQELDCLRYFKQSHLLQVAAAEVSGKMPLMKVSDYLTFTAEVILDAVLSLSWRHLTARHGYPVHVDGNFGEPDFAIIGYGKLGGLEMSFNSDLDLVFLHRAQMDEDTVASEGQARINSRAFYIKLAQRIMLTLGTHTMSGKLYEVDLRLRPSGESGLLVSSLDAFGEYQKNNAWTWEHQALVRARGVAGNMSLIEKFGAVRAATLSGKRDLKVLVGEVASMRQKMRENLKEPSTGQLARLAFDIKQGRGGIVDIEFLVQFLVLAHSSSFPALLTYTDNYRILEAAGASGLLLEGEMSILIHAYLELRAASHQIDLQQPEGVRAAENLVQLQGSVVEIWNKIIGTTGGE